ncbi:hypothetical protein ACFFU9_13110 [Mariniflexile ostreae]|uniref:Uncharacterized protein n=1 Tax=Mariniflexile ostreae TaxID=1520892 RepID=A0ABV5FE15_9FLAO
MTKEKLRFKNVVVGSVFATLIAITPYLFYLHESVPDTKDWNTFLFSYNSGYYDSSKVAMWVLTGKIIPLYLMFLWFFTCRHWWYHALLVPIAMYSYQIFEVISKEDEIIFDSNQLIYLLPIMAIIIPSIYLIRAKLFNSINEVNKSMQELEDEFKITPKGFWKKITRYF